MAYMRTHKDRFITGLHIGGGGGITVDSNIPDMGVWPIFARLFGRGDQLVSLNAEFMAHSFHNGFVLDVAAMSLPVSFNPTEIAQASSSQVLTKLNLQLHKEELEALLSIHSLDDYEPDEQYEVTDANPPANSSTKSAIEEQNDADTPGDLSDYFEEMLPRRVHTLKTLVSQPIAPDSQMEHPTMWRAGAILNVRRRFRYQQPSWFVIFARREDPSQATSGYFGDDGSVSLSADQWRALLDPSYREALTAEQLALLAAPYVCKSPELFRKGGSLDDEERNGWFGGNSLYLLGHGRVRSRSGYGYEEVDL